MIKLNNIVEGVCFLWNANGFRYKLNLLKYFLLSLPARAGFKYYYNNEISCRIKDIKFIFQTSSSELYSSKEILIDRMYEQLPEFDVKNQNVIIDIGANIGLYSLLAAKSNRNCKVFSFEPNPDTYKRFEYNIRLNNIENIYPYKLAVSDFNGLSYFKKSKNTWVSKITDSKDMETIEVDTITLDEIIKDNSIEIIDLLKIDVEGSELNVIKGSTNTIKIVKKIILEYHSKELQKNCLDILDENGFRIVYEKPLIHDIGTVYCVNNELSIN